MNLANHHRIHEQPKNAEKFQLIHSKKSVKILDRWVLAVGILAPLTTLPQVIQILQTHDASGVSILTWVLFVVMGLFWLAYGYAHEEKPIIVTNYLWIIVEVLVIVLTIIYQ